jgi:hypothetical protein
MIVRKRNSALWLLLAVAGYIIWSAAFVFLYSFQGFACASGLDNATLFGLNLATAILLIIWIAHLVAGGTLIAFARRSRSGPTRKSGGGDTAPFLADLTYLLAVAGIVSTFYVGVPVLFLDPCG